VLLFLSLLFYLVLIRPVCTACARRVGLTITAPDLGRRNAKLAAECLAKSPQIKEGAPLRARLAGKGESS
jgi:hypothetical protein